MSKAKIRLSQTEKELVINADFILTKNTILEKVKLLLSDLQDKQQNFLHHPQLFLAEDRLHPSPKISKGENYKGLPYLILDYPRIFKDPDIFAIRTMFWWGYFFSITLHLSGEYKKKFDKKILASHSLLSQQGFFYCINNNQWEHDFDSRNYLSLSAISKNELEKSVTEKTFTKLSIKIPLHQWDDASEILLKYYKEIIEMLDT
jgi:hypothetical protein